MIKIGTAINVGPLNQAINCCLQCFAMLCILPNNPKFVSVVPFDKVKPDKYEVLSYRPISILNAFSKIYEKLIKKQLVSILIRFLLPLYQRIVAVLSRFLFVC